MRHRHRGQKSKDQWYAKRRARRAFEAAALLSWKGGHTRRISHPCKVTMRAPSGFRLNTRWKVYTEQGAAERRRAQIFEGRLTASNGLSS